MSIRALRAIFWSALIPSVVLLGVFALFWSDTDSGYALAGARGSSWEITHTVFLPVVFSNYEPPVPTVFGVQMYADLTSPSAGLTHTQAARVYWVRWPMAWSAVEPVDTIPANYNFSYYDASILATHRAGLQLIVTIVGNPRWAATYANGPIDKVDIGEFTEFIGTVVERYDGDGYEDAPGSPVVDYWEFYNEPDGGNRLRAEYGDSYWGHFGTEYAQMLCAVYPVIKAASPRAQVALGGLAYDWFEDQGGPFVRNFLDDILAAGGGNCFDVMNFHYYPAFESVWSSYGPGLTGKANYLRNKLSQYGLRKPMICTETGWFSGGHSFPSTPDIQASYVPKLFVQSLAADLKISIWFSWIDPPGYGDWGLLTLNLDRKPAFYAYRAAAKYIGRASFQNPLPVSILGSSALEGYSLILDQKPLYVLWSRDEVTRTVALPLMQAQIIDKYGQTIGLSSDSDDGLIDGKIKIAIGPTPIYVEKVP